MLRGVARVSNNFLSMLLSLEASKTGLLQILVLLLSLKQPASQPQLYWNTPILLTTHLHAQTSKLRIENLHVDSNAQQTNKSSKLFPSPNMYSN